MSFRVSRLPGTPPNNPIAARLEKQVTVHDNLLVFRAKIAGITVREAAVILGLSIDEYHGLEIGTHGFDDPDDWARAKDAIWRTVAHTHPITSKGK
jgi:hypothetical protein